MKTPLILLACCLLSAPALCANPRAASTAQTSASKQCSTPRSVTWTGWATWFSRESCRREGTGGARVLMANGKPLSDQSLVCALPWKPDGTLYRVTMRNGADTKSVVVRHADRGPGKKSRARGVVIDLTPAAMMILAGSTGIKSGRVKVKVEKIIK